MPSVFPLPAGEGAEKDLILLAILSPRATVVVSALDSRDVPPMQTYARRNFRHLVVDQQYPPVWCTPGLRESARRKKCNKTRSKNQCTGRWSCRSFWTEVSKHKGHTRARVWLQAGAVVVWPLTSLSPSPKLPSP